jgi:ubiquitin C-terminal hydrolase
MFKLTEKPAILQQFHSNAREEKSTFLQVQRLIWEKSLFPQRFPACSVFLCSSCTSKTRDLSFCLQCGRTFCGGHFGEHNCPPGFGVDIATRQLFLFSPALGRRFLFDASIDLLIISAKLAVIDGLPLASNLDPQGSILPIPRPPMPLQNLGNTCWLNSMFQCFVVNPLLQKWFLSSSIHIAKVDCAEAAVHTHLCRLFLAQVSEGTFSLADCLFAIWTLFHAFATPQQCDTHEFLMELRGKLDEFYQRRFETQVFSSIFNWQFKVIESCESCDETRTYIENAADLILPITGCSSLEEAMSHFLLGSSPLKCNSCQNACKRQYFFNSLPPTLTISLGRGRNMSRAMTPIKLTDALVLDEFVDADKKREIGDARYSLIGMVVRPGQGETGHYWANVKRSRQWFHCDDNTVQPISDVKEVLQQDACLLFFTRNGFVAQ